MSKTEMTNKVRELKELKAMADELAAEITAIEDSIKADMTAQDVEEITVDVYKVRYKTVSSAYRSVYLSCRHQALYARPSAVRLPLPDRHIRSERQTEKRRRHG